MCLCVCVCERERERERERVSEIESKRVKRGCMTERESLREDAGIRICYYKQ